MVKVEEATTTEPLGVQESPLADMRPESGDRVKLLAPVLGDLVRVERGGEVKREVLAVAGQIGKVTEVRMTANSSSDKASVDFDAISCWVPLDDLEVVATDRKVEPVEDTLPSSGTLKIGKTGRGDNLKHSKPVFF